MAVLSMLAGSIVTLSSFGLWLAVAYSMVFYYRWFTRTPRYPGPFPFPFIGNLPQFLGANGDLAAFAMHMWHKYGDRCEFWVLGDRYVQYNHADDVARMFIASSENKYLARTPAKAGLDEIGVGDKGIIFNRNLDSWRFHRKFFDRAISSPKLMTRAFELTRSLVAELRAHWKDLGADPIVELDKWTHRLTADAITTIATGKCDGAMKRYAYALATGKPIQETGNDLVSRVDNLFNVFGYFLIVPDFLRTYVLWPVTRSLLRRRQEMMDTTLDIVDEQRKNLGNGPQNFVSALLSHSDDTRPISVEEACHNIAEMLGGGIDTTSNSLCFIIYYVARDPEIERRIVAELNGIFGDSSRDIEEADIPKLKYVSAVISEVARLQPVVPVLWKTPSVDDVIDNQLLKAGTQTLVNIHGIHMNPAHWEDPERFDPDRFLSRELRSGFLQFGGGLRICPGRNLATLELRVVVACLYRHYTFELIEPEIKARFTIVTHATNFNVRVHPRKKAV